MAGFLVVVELVGTKAHPASLEALGVARRIGTQLGATVYAVVACAEAPGYGDEDLISVLSRAGADKVLLVTAPSHAGPLRWGAHGPAVVAASQMVRPVLVLVAGTHGGRDLTGRVASRLGAACIVDASLEIEDDELLLIEGAGATTRQIDGDLDFAVVAALPPGRYELASGDEEAEVEMLEAPPPERDFQPVEQIDAGQSRALVLGEGPAANALAEALKVKPGADAAAPLAIAPTEAMHALAEQYGATRVVVGQGASECGHAHYAVEGDPATVARALAGLSDERGVVTAASEVTPSGRTGAR